MWRPHLEQKHQAHVGLKPEGVGVVCVAGREMPALFWEPGVGGRKMWGVQSLMGAGTRETEGGWLASDMNRNEGQKKRSALRMSLWAAGDEKGGSGTRLHSAQRGPGPTRQCWSPSGPQERCPGGWLEKDFLQSLCPERLLGDGRVSDQARPSAGVSGGGPGNEEPQPQPRVFARAGRTLWLRLACFRLSYYSPCQTDSPEKSCFTCGL